MNLLSKAVPVAVAALSAAASISPTHAAVVASYDMTTLNIAGTMSASPNGASLLGVTAGNFIENLTGGTEQLEFGIQSTGFIPAGVNGASARSMNANPANPWWQFTVTPDSGYSLQFTSLVLDAGVQSGLTGATNWDYNVSWSVDNFISVLGTFDGPSIIGIGGPAVATGLTVNLSSLPTLSSPVTFRITPNRVSGTNGATGQRVGWIDNVVLNGTASSTAIPEPSAVLGLGLLGLGAFCKRKLSQKQKQDSDKA